MFVDIAGSDFHNLFLRIRDYSYICRQLHWFHIVHGCCMGCYYKDCQVQLFLKIYNTIIQITEGRQTENRSITSKLHLSFRRKKRISAIKQKTRCRLKFWKNIRLVIPGSLGHRLRQMGFGVIMGVRSCLKKFKGPDAYLPEIHMPHP